MEEECTHYDWYNDEDGKIYCDKCNKHIDTMERLFFAQKE
jgi:hypothetical protein